MELKLTFPRLFTRNFTFFHIQVTVNSTQRNKVKSAPFGILAVDPEFDVTCLRYKLPSILKFILTQTEKEWRDILHLPQHRIWNVNFEFHFFPSTSTDAHSFHVVLGNRWVITQVVRRRNFTSHIKLFHQKMFPLLGHVILLKCYLARTLGIAIRIGQSTTVKGRKLMSVNFL